ncbi:GGDEF domain-containing protein [Marinospirillum insulare]|uniref:diguanylate cyclase n=1 Tax=Marinospirillum insulare TaxID=217169 RepID=A0ABQ5ZU70_9GAMM|nr:diguanylate cyclase [Marinospirillum insulare]GLR62578.1 GGDEF domain-containing protein [Marinospirillum insulare]
MGKSSERRRFSLKLKRQNPWSPPWMPASLRDSLNNRHHSRDFNFARSEYLRTRVLFVAIVFFLLAPLWIVVDYLLLPEEMLTNLVASRLILMALLALVIISALRNKHQLNRIRNTLALLLLLPAIFYFALVIFYSDRMISLVGYNFIPLLIIAFLSVFPLTLIESLGIGLTVIGIQFFALTELNELTTAYGGQNLGLLVIVLAISLWANHSQVSTLLRLYRQASMDSLTQLLNRGVLLEQLKQLCECRDEKLEANDIPAPITLLMFDLDKFKRINDTYGHSVGDQVLQVFAQVLRDELRNNDLIARYGGEEFIAVLPGTPKIDAIQVAERIRLQSEKATVIAHDGEAVNFTTSIGITEIRFDETLDAALNRVDARLYKAKSLGRNRYVAYDSPKQEDTYSYF